MNGIFVPNIDLGDYDALELGVSRQHAMIEQHYGVFTLTDLGSTNGTHVNGRRLMIGENRILRHGDVVCLGKLVIYIYMV
jgi:pSer/pThr/pTyr-binding forkhead associated (FHA) protein